MDWLNLLAVQGTLKSLFQHHSSKSSSSVLSFLFFFFFSDIYEMLLKLNTQNGVILELLISAFFIVQLSHPYMTTGKTMALTRQTFVGRVMSLLYNMLSRLVVAFLPRSKCFLISQLQSPSAVILEPKKIKFVTVSITFKEQQKPKY